MYAQTTSDLISISNESRIYTPICLILQSFAFLKQSIRKWYLKTEMDDEQIQIPPMILITFVENSFKYGVSSDTDCTIFYSYHRKGRAAYLRNREYDYEGEPSKSSCHRNRQLP